jgi:hypothetical protein
VTQPDPYKWASSFSELVEELQVLFIPFFRSIHPFGDNGIQSLPSSLLFSD